MAVAADEATIDLTVQRVYWQRNDADAARLRRVMDDAFAVMARTHPVHCIEYGGGN